MKTSMLLAGLLVVVLADLDTHAQTRRIPARVAKIPVRSKIDALVFGRLRKLGIQPAGICSDGVFVRRVYLDVIGTVPKAEEVRTFLADKSPEKRCVLIDRLLKHDQFADYWAMKWSDLLRVKAEFPINLWPNAAKAYHRWIRTSIKEGTPYDQFARELLTGSGSNFRVPQVNFYRAVQSADPQVLAQAAALTFMGVRADKWERKPLAGLAACFSHVGYKKTQEWKEEIVFFDSVKAAKDVADGKMAIATFPDGTSAKLSAAKDPREVFADWLITPKNPWFTRNITNRVWCWLVGRGVIHPADDIRINNPPANAELLALLGKELVRSGYDLKHLYRLILNSQTYQQSSIPKTANPAGEANFAYYPIRRLDAEVLIDALCQITGTTETYSSAIPEPFTFVPENCRSIALPDGSITSSFLELFGRPSRDTGLESERSNNPTAAQRLHLLNSSHIRRKIERSKALGALMATSRRQPDRAVNSLYLTILSRYPTEAERKIVAAYTKTGQANGSSALVDVAWALFNSAEFLYRH